MDSERIKSIIRSKTSIRKALQHIGMTEQGFYRSILNNNIQVKKLEELSKFLEISILDFFEDGKHEYNNSYVSEDIPIYESKSKKVLNIKDSNTIEQLIKIIEMKEKKELDLIEIIKNQSLNHK